MNLNPVPDFHTIVTILCQSSVMYKGWSNQVTMPLMTEGFPSVPYGQNTTNKIKNSLIWKPLWVSSKQLPLTSITKMQMSYKNDATTLFSTAESTIMKQSYYNDSLCFLDLNYVK